MIQKFEEFVNENNPMSPWSNGVLAMGDDSAFLKVVWHYDMEALKSLETKTEEDLSLCKKSQSSAGILKPIWKKDKLGLEWRLKCIKQIIKSKTEDPEYIPNNYK